MGKNELGQTLIETLISFGVLFLSAFAVIEVVRLLAFKTMLQTVTSSTAMWISHSHLELLRANIIPNSNGIFYLSDKEFERRISDKISNDLMQMKTTLISFDHRDGQVSGVLSLARPDISVSVQFVNQTHSKGLQSGVHIKVNTCLPVLFSSYFKSIAHNQNTEVGKSVGTGDRNRTCSGHFSASKMAPLFWFRVRAAAYSPWPASSEIYLKGYAFPQKIYGLENEFRQDVSRAIQELSLNSFFMKRENNGLF